jgi:8-oxo-dGTP diphosphatase
VTLGTRYHSPMAPPLPHRLAVLCYLFDDRGRLLLLHRRKPPNQNLYSPVGGKVEVEAGESPTACARREIQEETGLSLAVADLHLTGIVSECGYEGECHWLMFLYEAMRPVVVAPTQIVEGRLEWHEPEALKGLPMPQTDRHVIWPLFDRYRGRFFAVHIDCAGSVMRWRLEQPASDCGPWINVEGEGGTGNG